eukprot:124921_1
MSPSSVGRQRDVSTFRNHTSVETFVRASTAQIGHSFDIDAALRSLASQWVTTVHDLRLCYVEGALAALHLPADLSAWVRLQVAKDFVDDEVARTIVDLIFQKALDDNGLFYFLGSSGKTKVWKNPADLGLVVVTSSSSMTDSAKFSRCLGRDLLRVTTKPLENSWMQIHLVRNEIKLRRYMLRHYKSWDTEGLRNWRLEGSVNGRDWILLSEHHQDATLNKKGACGVWKVDCKKYMSFFRIWQTGLNANKHNYLALSCIEFYGSLRELSAENAVVPSQVKGRVFKYQFDFDTFGILYYLGTNGGKSNWQNPARAGLVSVRSSGCDKDVDVTNLVGRAAVRCVTSNKHEPWFAVDLRGRRVNPSHYTMRHYSCFDSEAVRNWHFQGSNDGHTWTTLMTHKDDQSLKFKGATCTWRVPPQPTAFSQFRLWQYDTNSNRHWYLACSGFELYGTMADDEKNNDIDSLADDMKQMVLHNALEAEVKSASEPATEIDCIVLSPQGAPFGTDGLMYFLGTKGHSAPWKNPTSLGFVQASSTPLMADSVPVEELCGLSVVRLVTKAQKLAAMQLRFAQLAVRPSHYSLRHYESWDTEALRNWRLEGSNDGKVWVTLDDRKADQSLQKKGSTCTLRVKAAEFFSFFRILLTGPNSNNHYYVALSGFELFGTVRLAADFLPAVKRTNAASRPVRLAEQRAPPASVAAAARVAFRFERDFDENGIIYYLGTDGRRAAWKNPVDLGAVSVDTSGLMADSEPAKACVGRACVRCVTTASGEAFFAVKFRNHFVRPTHYSVKHYSSWDTETLRNWNFQASNDNQTWVTLREHHSDISLNIKGDTHTWSVNCARFYSHFRLVQTGPNSNNHLYMACSGFELYGALLVCDPVLRFSKTVAHKSQMLEVVEPAQSSVVYRGSQNSWQSVRAQQAFARAQGTSHSFAALLTHSTTTTNSWLAIVGLVPADFSCQGSKQWVGSQDSFGYVAGTGGSVSRQAKSQPFGSKWGASGDLLGCTVDYARKTIEFFLNGVSQGIAFPDFKVKGDVLYPAVSLTGKNARMQFVQRIDQPAAAEALPRPSGPLARPVQQASPPAPLQCWDFNRKSAHMVLNDQQGFAYNRGSHDNWQIVLSKEVFSSGRPKFDLDIVQDSNTTNKWRFIFGVAPASFEPKSSCWLGSQGSWGYIAGLGGIVHKSDKHVSYGETFGVKDKISVQLDFQKHTIEFFRNGKSQGVAFTNLNGPVRAGTSMTGTRSAVKLTVVRRN